MKNKLGSVLRGVLVVLMGATAVMTLLGAVGTACLAWNGDKYGPAFKWIVPYMLNYQVVVYISLAAGVAAAIVSYAIARGDRWFYLGGLITLLVAGGAVAYQMYMTSTLRNIPFLAPAPANIRFYITLVTLIAFAFVRLPGLWNKGGLGDPKNKPGSPVGAGGIAMIVSGLLILTAPYWAAPTHMLDGYNLVLTLEVPLLVDGIALVVAGVAMLVSPILYARLSQRVTVAASK
jgi:hypothetical protein